MRWSLFVPVQIGQSFNLVSQKLINPKQLQSQASKFIQRDLQANKCAQNRKQKDLFSFVFFIWQVKSV